jgi:hypothetical protein
MTRLLKGLVRSLQCTLSPSLRRFVPSVEVAVALAIVAILGASLFYFAGLMSPELALLGNH